MLDALAQLARTTTAPLPDTGEITDACEIIARTLNASDAYVLRAGDPHFVRLGSDEEPTAYEIKQKGYWLIWQTFAANPTEPAGVFNVVERIVQDGRKIEPGQPSTHLASVLPSDESNSELLIVRGPWPEGLTQPQVDFVIAARPMLSYLVANVLDTERRNRQRQQLMALADVSKAFSEASEMGNVLESIATAMAKASGFDWVMITLYNDALDTAIERAVNVARYSDTQIAATVRQGRFEDRQQPATQQQAGNQNGDDGAFLRDLVRRGRPFLMPDVMDPKLETMPEVLPHLERFKALRAFYVRAHIISTGFFAIMFQNKPLGMAAFSSSTKREFSPQEVDLLQAVVSQAATAIKGLRLYRDLERSQAELRHYAEKLEEASRVEHLIARTDALTGLPNRRYIEEVMETECARACRYRDPVTVAMADLDRFKLLNDGFGHHTGDDALRFVAEVARRACRASDFVGRWGGDEFVFILPSTTLDDATHFAERFRRALSSAEFVHPRLAEPARMTISIGIAQISTETATNAKLLLEQADQALYRAKEGGRDRVEAAPSRACAA